MSMRPLGLLPFSGFADPKLPAVVKFRVPLEPIKPALAVRLVFRGDAALHDIIIAGVSLRLCRFEGVPLAERPQGGRSARVSLGGWEIHPATGLVLWFEGLPGSSVHGRIECAAPLTPPWATARDEEAYRAPGRTPGRRRL
jgi:hypothetical protein